MLAELAGAAFTLVFLWVVFGPLERLFPRREQRVFRREWWTDLTFFTVQTLLWRVLAFGALAALAIELDALAPDAFRQAVWAQPVWLQAVEVVVLCDLTVYWGHRLSHRSDFLWKFHRVHHTAERLDWLAAYREHPVDGLYTVTLENLAAIVLGFPLELIAGFVVFRGVWAVFIHSNVRLPLGPFKVLLGSPELHHWHHDEERGASCNFANLSPLMDVIFGTYYAPRDREPGRLGTPEPVPRSYLGQLAYPFVELYRDARSSLALRRKLRTSTSSENAIAE